MKYGKILSKAWQILRHHQPLWPFGLIASGFSGIAFLLPFTQGDLIRFISDRSNPDQILLSVLTYLFALLVLSLLTFLISLFGTIGLILGVLDIQAKKKIGFKRLAKQSWRFYGRALKLNVVLTTLPLLVPIALVILGALVFFITAGLAIFCMLPLFFLIIPFSFLYYIYLELANVMLISENLDYRTAISRSWKLFKANWGSLAILGLILTVGSAILGTVINTPLSFMYSPTNPTDPFSNISIPLLVAFIPIITIFYSAARVYMLSSWTLAYTQIRPAKGSKSVIQRKKK